MSDYIIKVENLGKKYQIRHQQERQKYVAMRDIITNKAKDIGSWVLGSNKKLISQNGNSANHRNGNPHKLEVDPQHLIPNDQPPSSEDFWALRGVSFEVKQGEVLGIIGRNGAGKSTLLKILSRITKPSEGQVHIRGRVASLLEVGTGFHPELTGRENIFLNAAILGMTREEITRKFDEIVAFAEVEKFLDTPVKRYSSGMYVRLAFSVAAHLEPEILIVDEVLAVGDTQFQKKCMGKMGEVSRAGRTVLFVSHNLAALQHLCPCALLLNNGRLVKAGFTERVLEQYVSPSDDKQMHTITDLRKHRNRLQNAIAFFTEIEVTVNGVQCITPRMGEGLEFRLRYESPRPLSGLGIGITINDRHNQRLVAFSADQQAPESLVDAPRKGVVHCRIPSLILTADVYHITVISADNSGELDRIEDCCSIEVLPSDVFGTGKPPGREHGVMFLRAEWEASWRQHSSGFALTKAPEEAVPVTKYP